MKQGQKFTLALLGLLCLGAVVVIFYGSGFTGSEPSKLELTDTKKTQATGQKNTPDNQSGEVKEHDVLSTTLEITQPAADDIESDLNSDLYKTLDEQRLSDQANDAAGNADIVDTSVGDSAPNHVNLWQLEDYEDIEVDTIPAIQTVMPLANIQHFKVGQALSFELPGDTGEVNATLTNATNPLPGVKVWEGKMDIAGSEGNVIVSQGQIETQFTITTPATVYTASVDNKTGRTVIIDQAEYAQRILPIDDTAKLDPSELIPLP